MISVLTFSTRSQKGELGRNGKINVQSHCFFLLVIIIPCECGVSISA